MSQKCVGAEGEAVNPHLNFRTCKQAKDWFRLSKETLLIVWFSGNAEQKVVIGYNYVFAAKPWLRGSQKLFGLDRYKKVLGIKDVFPGPTLVSLISLL